MMIEKVMALLEGLHATELEKLPPARLQRFAQLCNHWRQRAERRRHQVAEGRAGVLSDLKRGERSE